MMGVGDYGMGGKSSDGKLKKLMEVDSSYDNLLGMNMRLEGTIIGGEKGVPKKLKNKFRVIWVCEVNEWKKSGVNEKIEDEEVEIIFI